MHSETALVLNHLEQCLLPPPPLPFHSFGCIREKQGEYTTAGIMCLHSYWCACTHTGVPALILVCLHSYWCACTHTGVPAFILVCLHSYWCACTHTGVPALILVCLHSYSCACTHILMAFHIVNDRANRSSHLQRLGEG